MTSFSRESSAMAANGSVGTAPALSSRQLAVRAEAARFACARPDARARITSGYICNFATFYNVVRNFHFSSIVIVENAQF